MDAQAGATLDECHTGFFHLPSAMLTLIFSREKDSAVPFPVDRDAEFCLPTK